MHLFTNFVKETGNTSLRVFAQNGKLWWLSHHNCSCSNDFNLSTRRGKSHADLLHFLKSRLKFGMAVALLWVSHTPEEHCSFTIKPKETDPPGAAMGSKGSASPPVWLWLGAQGLWAAGTHPPLGATRSAHHLLCVLENSPGCGQPTRGWAGIGACSPAPSTALPITALRPQAGTSITPELLVLILVENTAPVGVNSQELGNARQNQLKKWKSFCWHLQGMILIAEKPFLFAYTQGQSMHGSTALLPNGAFWICIVLHYF